MKLPRQFFKPLAIGAPEPMRELPVRLERMIHFIPPHVEKMRAKAGEIAGQVDVVLGNLEDAIPLDAKVAARDGFIAASTWRTGRHKTQCPRKVTHPVWRSRRHLSGRMRRRPLAQPGHSVQ